MAEQRSYTRGFDNRWLFTGKELDESTGLYYFGARFYNPSTSIWLSVDPLAEQAPSWTPYRYGFQNPINYTDPTGMFEEGPIFDEKYNLIGHDGKMNGKAYVVTGKVKKAVIDAQSRNEFYEGDLSDSNNVFSIPFYDIIEQMDISIKNTLNSGKTPID